jgi:hypothetical protein
VAGEGYPDIETLIVAWLKTQLDVTQIHAGDIPDDVPQNLPGVVPLIMVSRFGGADRVLGFDNPAVDIDVFASSRAAAIAHAGKAQRAMLVVLPRQTLTGAVITRVQTIGPPISVPWDSSTVRRVNASYQLGVHHPI